MMKIKIIIHSHHSKKISYLFESQWPSSLTTTILLYIKCILLASLIQGFLLKISTYGYTRATYINHDTFVCNLHNPPIYITFLDYLQYLIWNKCYINCWNGVLVREQWQKSVNLWCSHNHYRCKYTVHEQCWVTVELWEIWEMVGGHTRVSHWIHVDSM